METPIIEFDCVSKSYGKKAALTDVSLKSPRGTIFGCVGPNGAGKTTIVRLILGLLTPDTGSVRVLGGDASGLSLRDRRRIGYVLESPGIYQDLTVRQNLEFYARLYGADGLADKVIANLAGLKVAEYADQPAGRLSKGMKQQLAISRATLSEPDILVLDEPTAGLDPIYQKETRDLLKAYSRRGHTVFLCSHDMAQVERLCDLVLFLKEGRCLAITSAVDVTRRAETNTWVVKTVSRESKLPLVAKLKAINGLLRSEHDDRIEISIPPGDEPDFLALLSSQADLVQEVRRAVPTFEDTFFELMEDQ